MARKKRADAQDLRDIFCLIEDKIEQLENPCWECLYFDCAKNPYNKQLKKQFREAELVDWKGCLKQRKEELKRMKKLLKRKEFKEFLRRRKEEQKRLKKRMKSLGNKNDCLGKFNAEGF